MKSTYYLSSWVKRFLLEYLISIRNLSKNTQLSYRDSFRLILSFMTKKSKKSVDKFLVIDVTPEVVKAFLHDLEKNRKCSVSTRNQRLASIHAFAKFVGLNSPEHIEWCRQIQMIPLKKEKRTLITYLEKNEMDALLNAPNKKTEQGKRDYAVILFLYNTGARADEAAQLTIGDLNIAHAKKRDLSTVLIRGKGNKLRRCPLWQQTVNELEALILNREQSEHVFLNRCKQPLTRFGIHSMIKRYVKEITKVLPSMAKKQISPHTIRHTTALIYLGRVLISIQLEHGWVTYLLTRLTFMLRLTSK